MNAPWALFSTEIGLVALALTCLVLDLIFPDDAHRGQRLANTALAGIALLFLNLMFFRREVFGTALGTSFVQDGLSVYFKALFLLAGFFTVFMAGRYQKSLKRGHGEFILLILFALIGMSFLASANDLLLFFISLETLSVSLYIMVAYLRDKSASVEAGLKYVVLGALSTAVLVYGMSFMYGSTGSTSFTDIQARLAAGPVPKAFILGSVLVLSSLAFKIAAVPFHLWVPDVYEGAPTPVTAFLAIGSKAAGFAALIRLLGTVFAPEQEKLMLLFAILAALSILYGNLGAIPQGNIKRLLGYSSIGHAGYLLIGLAAFHGAGKEALLYYLLAYLFSTGAAFLVIVAVSDHLGDNISDYSGLARRSPLLAATMLLALLSLAGVPPLAGFFAKFYVLWAAVRSGLLWLAVIGIVNVVTALYYYLRIVKAMYLDKPLDALPIPVTPGQRLFQYFALFGILAIGIYQAPFVGFAASAFSK